MKPRTFFSLAAILIIGACKSSDNAPVLRGEIADTTARRLVKNFDNRAYQIHHGGLCYSDARCVWFSIDQLNDLVTRINHEGGDGIRFYLATYDSIKHKDALCKPKYQHYSTLVMVSTRDSLRPRGHKKYDTLHFDYYNDKARNMRGGIITATPENQGELCPPPSSCYVDGALLLQP